MRPVLDVAAGSGAVGRHLARAVAVDVSLEQLRRNKDAWLRVRADGERLPFRADSFAAAVCGFGINHVADPGRLLREMGRVAPVVGVSTWQRPERPYPPKQAVFDCLARRAGGPRSAVGELLDGYSDAVGSVDAVAELLRGAELASRGRLASEVEVPWPGVDAYLDYRLSMPTSAPAVDDADLRAELREVLGKLPLAALTWRRRRRRRARSSQTLTRAPTRSACQRSDRQLPRSRNRLRCSGCRPQATRSAALVAIDSGATRASSRADPVVEATAAASSRRPRWPRASARYLAEPNLDGLIEQLLGPGRVEA